MRSIVIAVAACVTLLAEPERKPAPDFNLKDYSGRTVKLSDYRGKVVLLNFWATWCGGCKQELPWFQEFDTSYRKQGFAVLAVSVDEGGWGVVKPYLASTKLSLRTALADKAMPGRYNVTNMPATFLIDRKGRIANAYVGVIDRGTVQSDIQNLLEQVPNRLQRPTIVNKR